MGNMDFSITIGIWLKDLQLYTFEQICRKPSKNNWSLGQVGMHLIKETDYFFEQVRTCAGIDDNQDKAKSMDAVIMFRNGQFPDEMIEGPPSNQNTPQPANIELLVSDFKRLKKEIETLESLIFKTTHEGKTEHPGLGHFNAKEWLQFAEMHFRHHLRQKKRIEDFLESKKN